MLIKNISTHSGHNPTGKIGCGAVGFLDESKENRKVNKYLIRYLRKFGLTVYDDTVNNGTSQKDVLQKIIKKIRKHKHDLIISLHLNSGVNDKKGNGKTSGCEILVKNINDDVECLALRILNSISSIGFTNRGIKTRENLYILNNVNDTPCLLIEMCFVDDIDDYKKFNAKKMASAIAEAIVNETLTEKTIKFRTTKSGVKERDTISLNKKYVVDSMKYNTLLNIDKVRIIDGNIYGHRKKANTWVLLKYVKACE